MHTYCLTAKQSLLHPNAPFRDWGRFLSDTNIELSFVSNTIRSDGKPLRSVVIETDQQDPEDLQAMLDDLVFVEMPQTFEPAAESSFAVKFVSESGDKAVAGAQVFFIEEDQMVMIAQTDQHGIVQIQVDEDASGAEISLHGFAPAHYSFAEKMVISGNEHTVKCKPLPHSPDGIYWWHKFMGIEHRNQCQGQGIKVAVIDTGCGWHPATRHVKHLGVFNNSFNEDHGHEELAGWDTTVHGTPVCGLIGGDIKYGAKAMGLAPEADLYSLQLYIDAHSYPLQSDMNNALDFLIYEHPVDIINISQTSSANPKTLQSTARLFQEAYDAGIVSIAAAGNDGGRTLAPACFSRVIGVSAVGRIEHCPGGNAMFALERTGIDEEPTSIAKFSCRGDGIDCCAPGVGLIVCMPATHDTFEPDNGVCSMDGTSFAAPLVTGALATILSQDTTYQALSDAQRSKYAVDLLYDHCQDCGLAPLFQGYGCPAVGRV